ncbi:MAG: histidine--tRNA ligase [Sphingobacteriales bacterium]|nr:MAG: histidine--tRNA ligase [Sphingobacteriales bacterium]
MSKPSIPQGTRDFSPEEVRKRQYIFNTLRNIFEQYGFQPLETPSMENLVTLTGKYGEEGDRLIFKVLNNGLHEKKDADKGKLNDEWNKVLSKPYSTPAITERALRYDLTIPFARYVVMHQHELALPFRRYQMQPVWRADRPQKGRYREFWQCDADVVGSTSLINEAELLCIYQSAFHQLKLPQVAIKVNSRKLLAGLAEVCGAPEMMMDITIALDKLDKIGWDGVANELQQRGISDDGISSIKKVIEVTGTNEGKLASLEQIMATSETGMKGIEEIRQTLAYHNELADANWQAAIEVDISLARGLNYYTGVIVEVVCRAVKIGSIGGGGRYDDLTGLFGVKGLSGVGVSFGIDRTYDVMEELELFPASVGGSKVMLTNFGGANETYALSVLKQLRAAGIAAEIYPDAAKFDKQMKYANKRGFAYVILAGDEEREKQMVSLKDFTSGAQEMIALADCMERLK